MEFQEFTIMTNKKTAPNKQFATSGGVARLTTCAKFQLLALVQAIVETPPAASCRLVICKRGTTQRDTEMKK